MTDHFQVYAGGPSQFGESAAHRNDVAIRYLRACLRGIRRRHSNAMGAYSSGGKRIHEWWEIAAECRAQSYVILHVLRILEGTEEAKERNQNRSPHAESWRTAMTDPRRAQQCSACKHVTCSECGYVVPPDQRERFAFHVCRTMPMRDNDEG